MAEIEGRLLTEKVGEVSVISFRDSQLRHQGLIERVGKELLELVSDRYKAFVVVNMENLEYFSSSMLGRLVAAHKKVVEGKGRMCLCAIRPVILEVFKITKMDKVFEIHPSVAAAVTELAKTAGRGT